MKTSCKQCGKEIEVNSPFCTYCGIKNNAANVVALTSNRKKHGKKTLFYCLGAIVVFIIFIIVLNINLLFPWQKEARLNKRAILSYAAEHYPDAVILKQKYESLNPNFLKNYSGDCIVFSWNSLEFGITAEGGKIVVDGYYSARAISQFDKIIQDDFLKPRGVKATVDYRFIDSYNESYPYTGRLSIRIEVFNEDITPREVGWFYDFYKYWKNEGAFLDGYGIEIIISLNKKITYHMYYDNNSDFPNEDAFYAAFKTGH